MKTDRLTLLISPVEKEALAAKAAHIGITISELMRRAALEFDPEREAELAELGLLTAELSRALERLRPKLDQAYAEIDATRVHLAGREAAAAQALAALEEDRSIDWSGIQWLFGMGGTAPEPDNGFIRRVDDIIGGLSKAEMAPGNGGDTTGTVARLPLRSKPMPAIRKTRKGTGL